jgi:CspA family cold shock protein
MTYTAVVKFFDDRKGFGFLEPIRGGEDVFVHVSALQASGCPNLLKGDTVSYELGPGGRNGRQMAVNLRIVCEAR